MFLDESGVRTDLIRRYGRGLSGARVPDHTPDGRWHTTTFLGALRVTGLTAPAVFDGPMTAPVEDQLGRYARYGVTTVFSLGGGGPAGVSVRDR